MLLHFFSIAAVLTLGIAQEKTKCVQSNWNVTCPLTCCCTEELDLNTTVNTLNCSSRQLLIGPLQPIGTQRLILSKNLVKDLGEKLVLSETVRELDLSENRIKTIRRGPLFVDGSNLVQINLARNELSTLFRHTLDGLSSLTELNLAENKINYFEDRAFTDLESLKFLNLELNTIGSLYEEWFDGLKNLETLNLAHNRIHHIGKNVFKAARNLKILYLNGNRISAIDPGGLAGLSFLEELHLDNNLLLQVPNAALEVLPRLEMLYLDSNPIVKLTSFSFCESNVSYIGLTHMPELGIVDALAFYNLPRLVSLQMKNNPKLSFFDRDGIRNVPSLKQFNLADNRLPGLAKTVFDSIPNTTKLSLSGNPFVCDCNSRWIRQQFGQMTKLESAKNLICSDPPAFRGMALKDVPLTKIDKDCKPLAIDFTMNQSVTRKLGDPLTLECRGLGVPPPILHWILPDGNVLNSSSNYVRIRLKNPGTLAFTHLKVTDTGPYTCMAENSLGSSNVTLTLDVGAIDILLFPTLISSTFVTLVWNGTARNAFPSYQIAYKPLSVEGNRTSVTVSSVRKSFTVNGLRPLTEYELCINYEEPKQDGIPWALPYDSLPQELVDDLRTRGIINKASSPKVGDIPGLSADGAHLSSIVVDHEQIWVNSRAKQAQDTDLKARCALLSIIRQSSVKDRLSDNVTKKYLVWMEVAKELKKQGFNLPVNEKEAAEKCRKQWQSLKQANMKYVANAKTTGQGAIKKPPLYDEVYDIEKDKASYDPHLLVDSDCPITLTSSGSKNDSEDLTESNTLSENVRPGSHNKNASKKKSWRIRNNESSSDCEDDSINEKKRIGLRKPSSNREVVKSVLAEIKEARQEDVEENRKFVEYLEEKDKRKEECRNKRHMERLEIARQMTQSVGQLVDVLCKRRKRRRSPSSDSD